MVRIWAPSVNDKPDTSYNSTGRIINIFDGWGGGLCNQQSNMAHVRVRAWGCME